MQNFDIDALPVGYSNFELLRKENQIYDINEKFNK